MKPKNKESLQQEYSLHNMQKPNIVRDPIFSRSETLYGMKYHTFNRIHFCVGHAFMIYYNYLWVTGQVPVSTVIFGMLENF